METKEMAPTYPNRPTNSELKRRIRILEGRIEKYERDQQHDSLTGLLNREGLNMRTHGRSWGWYVYADIDKLKDANDAHGHAYGDALLVEFANYLLSVTRGTGERNPDILLARIHGDEYILWTETEDAAARIAGEIRAWRSREGHTASAGIGRTREIADAEMYRNKKAR